MDYGKVEAAEAKRIGATLHKNSGRGMTKADASNDRFVIDFKYAEKSFTVNEKVWGKICTDAMRVDKNKSPMLYLILGGKTRLVIMEYAILEEILGEQCPQP